MGTVPDNPTDHHTPTPVCSMSLSQCGYVTIIIGAAVLVSGATVLAASWTTPDHVEPCTREMFRNKTGAFWACRAQFALQRNWFPDPIQGLFSYQTWNGMDGFWQNGVVLESMANALHYLNNKRSSSPFPNRFLTGFGGKDGIQMCVVEGSG